MSKTAAEMANFAKTQCGNGPSVYRNWYYGNYGSGINWCAVFCSYVANWGGWLNIAYPKTDGAGCFAREGVPAGQGTWHTRASGYAPQVGDLILYRYGGSYTDCYHSDHVGFVVGSNNSYVYTVEGNTGSADADLSSVNARTRDRGNTDIWGYYHPNYTNTEEDTDVDYKRGSKGDGVLAIKGLLNTLYLYGVVKTDAGNGNEFDDRTTTAVKELQTVYKLEIDGIAGAKTAEKLKWAVERKTKDTLALVAAIKTAAQKL